MQIFHIDVLLLALGIVFGLYLAIADWVAIETRLKHGFYPGVAVYVVMLVLPLVLMAVFGTWTVTIVGFVVGFIISGMMFMKRVRESRFAYAHGDFDGC